MGAGRALHLRCTRTAGLPMGHERVGRHWTSKPAPLRPGFKEPLAHHTTRHAIGTTSRIHFPSAQRNLLDRAHVIHHVSAACPAPTARSLKSLYPSADIFRIIFRRPKLLLLTPDRIRSDAQQVGPGQAYHRGLMACT